MLDKKFSGFSVKIMKIFFLILLLTIPLFIQSAWAADITLAWDPNTEPDLAGYKVYYGTASGVYNGPGSPINIENVTTYTLTNLTPGKKYFIAVTAYNTSNAESGYSNEIAKEPAPIDFDQDGKTDTAVYRHGTGAWYIIPSSGGAPYGVGWGGDATDKPVPGDYDGDGKTDIAVYRGSNGAWFIIPSSGGAPYGVGWGGDPSDKPVPGDYDGDGKTDMAVYRTSAGAWYVLPSGGGAPYSVGWGGNAADKPVPGDYDGDGKTDIAVYRGSNGAWFIIPSGGGAPYGVSWGGDPGDIPLSASVSLTY